MLPKTASLNIHRRVTMQKTRKFSMLEPLSLLFALILIAAVCTYVLPAGEFNRVENAETGEW